MSQLDSNEINIALLVLSGLVLILGLFSGWLKERFWLADPVLALLVGVLAGPTVFGWIHLTHWGKPEIILEQGSRIAIAIQVMSTALRLPSGYVQKHWRNLTVLLGLVMPIMWIVSGLLVYLILGIPFWVAMLVGAVVAPTDPVVATSVVTGKVAEGNLPERIRFTLSAESGINDGTAYLFVLLPILMLTKPPGEAIAHWLTRTLLWEIIAAAIIGGIIGYVAGKLLLWSEAKQIGSKQTFLAYTVALSLAVLAAVKLIGADGILAVFAAGAAFSMVVGGQEKSEEENVQDALDRFITTFVFILLGLAIPWQQWLDLGWRGLLLAIAILLLRRPPSLFLLRPLLSRLKSKQDALFMGWFGPIGASAMFYAFLALRQTGEEEPWIVGSLIICASILAHGLSSVPLAKLYKRHEQK